MVSGALGCDNNAEAMLAKVAEVGAAVRADVLKMLTDSLAATSESENLSKILAAVIASIFKDTNGAQHLITLIEHSGRVLLDLKAAEDEREQQEKIHERMVKMLRFMHESAQSEVFTNEVDQS